MGPILHDSTTGSSKLLSGAEGKLELITLSLSVELRAMKTKHSIIFYLLFPQSVFPDHVFAYNPPPMQIMLDTIEIKLKQNDK